MTELEDVERFQERYLKLTLGLDRETPLYVIKEEKKRKNEKKRVEERTVLEDKGKILTVMPERM